MGNDPLLGKNTPFWSARRLRSSAVSVLAMAVGVFTFAYRGEIVGFIHDAISRESLGGSFWGLALLPSAIAFLMVVGAGAALAISITMLSASELVALAGAKAVEIAYGVKFERASIPGGLIEDMPPSDVLADMLEAQAVRGDRHFGTSIKTA